MDYWAETMQDDVYLLVKEGWKAVVDGRPNSDLIPAVFIVNRYFAADQAAIDQLEVNRDAIARQMEDLDEEYGGEDGLLAEARNDKGNVNRASLKVRLAEISVDPDSGDERKLLKKYSLMIENEATVNRTLKTAVKTLDIKVTAKYGTDRKS